MNGEPSSLPRPGRGKADGRAHVGRPGRECAARREPRRRAGRKGGQHVARRRPGWSPRSRVGRACSRRWPAPTQITPRAMATDRARLQSGPGGQALGRGCRHDEQGEDEQRAGDLGGGRRRQAEQHKEAPPSSRTGTPCDGGHGGIDRGEQQGTPDERQHRDDAERDEEQDEDLAVGDAQEGAEQQARSRSRGSRGRGRRRESRWPGRTPAPCRSPPTPG